MLRTLATLLLCGLLSAVSAQDHDFQVQDTPAMKAKAKERIELLGRTVGTLTPEQTQRVEAVYMQVERHLAMVEHRMQGVPKADRDADMEHVYANMDAYEAKELKEILSEKQYARWEESMK